LFKDTYSLDRYPLSLGYLAGTALKETKWDVMVYNADFVPGSEMLEVSYLSGPGFERYQKGLKNTSARPWDEVISVIRDYKPNVIGITAKSQNFASACIIARLAKEVDKKTVVIVGGPHPSMTGTNVLNCPDIDISVIGEGERTLVELLMAIEQDRDINTVKGIVYRKNNAVCQTPQREYIENLDSLCFPNDSAPQVLKEYDRYPAKVFGYIFATRGCPYDCFFCGSRKIWSRHVRFRSVENCMQEIKNLRKRGLNFISFEDDDFGVSRKNIRDLCTAIRKQHPGLKWSCEIHVKLIDEETVKLMKESGCCSISLGVESGNNEILKHIRKNITIEEALAACRMIKKSGLRLSVFFMVGFPQETEESLNDTIRAMERIDCDFVVYSIFTPYPGTEAFEFCLKQGLIDSSYDVSMHNHHSPINSFCMNIAPERFKLLARKAEKICDRKNRLNRIKGVMHFDVFEKIRRYGILGSFTEGIRILMNK